jgi:purine catabolism regulator
LIIYNCVNSIIDKNNYLSTVNNDEIFIVIKCKSSDCIDDFLSRLVEQIKTYEDTFKESIGVARPYKELKDIKKLYEEASLAVLFSDNDIVLYNSLDTIKLLYPLKNSSEIQKYYNGTIKSLEKYDKKCGTNLMETLETYFKYNFKKSLVADKLYIHVETLRYRLNRIEEITGYSLDDSEGLFVLQMGLKLKKLIKIK